MPKFNVIMTRDTTESTVVDVEAIDEADARAKALEETSFQPDRFDWTVDDGGWAKPYATGCEEILDAEA